MFKHHQKIRISQKIINTIEIRHVCFCFGIYKQSEWHLKKVETSWVAGMVQIMQISFCWFFSMLFLFVYKSLKKAYNKRETWFWMDFWQKSMVFYGSESIFQHQKTSNFGAVWVITKIFYKSKLIRYIHSSMSHYFTAEMWFTCQRECPNINTTNNRLLYSL